MAKGFLAPWLEDLIAIASIIGVLATLVALWFTYKQASDARP
jgi:hypothetical protein